VAVTELPSEPAWSTPARDAAETPRDCSAPRRASASGSLAALFTGAGLSAAPPAALPLGEEFNRRLFQVCADACARVAPGIVDRKSLDALAAGRWNLLARLDAVAPGVSAGAVRCMSVVMPNEAHLLAALHLAHGGYHVTVNLDDGIETAHQLLQGVRPLPDGAPRAHREALRAWQGLLPRGAPALRVIAGGRCRARLLRARPLLVRLHGSAGASPDGVVRPRRPDVDDAEVTDLGHRRAAAIQVLSGEPFVLVTGYSGADFASFEPLVAGLAPGRFAWVAPDVPPAVRRTLTALDPAQPVTGRAVDALRSILPVEPPTWPDEPWAEAGFERRWATWCAALAPEVAATALASVLADAGWLEESSAIRDRVASGRAMAPSCGTGSGSRARGASAFVSVVLPAIERRTVGALASRPRRLVLRLAARSSGALVRRVLDRTGDDPSGRRLAVLRRQQLELGAIGAVLGSSPPKDAERSLGLLFRAFDHLSDAPNAASVLATRSLVLFAHGQLQQASETLREASRRDPPLTGVLAIAASLLDHHRDTHEPSRQEPGSLPSSRPGRRRRPDHGGESPDQLRAYVHALPKVELHVHLEGSVAPGTLAALARKRRDHRVPWTAVDVQRWYAFDGYRDFLNAYVLVCDQLQAPEDFYQVTTQLGARLASQNVRYAEVTVSPVAHVRRGISAEQLFAALEAGRRHVETTRDVRLRWCMAAGTRRGPAAARELVEMVFAHRCDGVVSVGLAGLETGASRRQFADPFASARDAGLHCVIHAGERAGADSIREAIDVLGAERIGHGIHCLGDPELVKWLCRAQIPIEVCLTSNVGTGVVATLDEHPIGSLLASGLAVTVNSDDPAMFHSSLSQEYLAVARIAGLQAPALADLARTAVRSAFLDPHDAATLLADLDAVPNPAVNDR
jgi:aminodeoxyfutalosine deaminase